MARPILNPEQPADNTPVPPTRTSTSDMESITTAVNSPSATSDGVPETITPCDKNPDPVEDPKPLPGWPEVAILIADTPDFQALPSFRDLTIKSLLYYQAELTQLRTKLYDAEYEDFSPGKSRKIRGADKYAENLEYLFRSQNSKNPNAHKHLHKQWDLIAKIRQVLKEYRKSNWEFQAADY